MLFKCKNFEPTEWCSFLNIHVWIYWNIFTSWCTNMVDLHIWFVNYLCMIYLVFFCFLFFLAPHHSPCESGLELNWRWKLPQCDHLGNNLQKFIISVFGIITDITQPIVHSKGVSGGSSDVIHDRFRCCLARKWPRNNYDTDAMKSASSRSDLCVPLTIESLWLDKREVKLNMSHSTPLSALPLSLSLSQ